MVNPKSLGRYQVSRLLGSGAFASVWLADDDDLGAQVAVKVLSDNWTQMPEVRARFVEEARILRRAESDRVIRVYDIGELPDGRPYFVMAYAELGTLKDRIATASLPQDDALRIAIEVARAVAVLHKIDVIHRDIKPSNVLIQRTLDGTERYVIADLGLAKSLAHGSGFTIAAGTPGYQAPEQEMPNYGLDARADVYSLGALAYELITGSTVERGSAESRPALPEDIGPALRRALEHDRELRWPDAESFATVLAEVAAARARSTAESGRHRAPTRRGLFRGKRARYALIALTLTVALVAGVLIWRGWDDHGGQHAIASPPTTTSSTKTATTTQPVVTTLVSSAPPSLLTTPSQPAPPPGKLDILFELASISGYRVDGTSIVTANLQSANLRGTSGVYKAVEVSVYSAGGFDPTEAQSGEPISVAGRSGFYHPAIPDPDTSDVPAQQTRKPAAVVQYAPGAWYVVQSDADPAAARSDVLRIAEAVRFGVRRPLRFPIRLGYVPSALTVCGALDGLDLRSGWNAWISLCDDTPGGGSGLLADAVTVFMNRERSNVPPANGTRINGLPTRIDSLGGTVDCGGFVLSIQAAENHRARYGPAEIQKIIEQLTVKSFDDKSSWFAGTYAAPTAA